MLESERQSKKGEIMSLLGSQERCQASIKELERSLVNSKQETTEAKQQLQEYRLRAQKILQVHIE